MNNKIISAITTILAFLLINPNVYPEKSNLLDVTYNNGIISIYTKDTALIDLFNAITEKTSTIFIYDKKHLVDKKITIELTNIPLHNAIKEILMKCDIKNYSTKLSEDPSIPIEQIEIINTPTPSAETFIPTEEPIPYYPEVALDEQPEPLPSEEDTPIISPLEKDSKDGEESLYPEASIQQDKEPDKEEPQEEPRTIQFIRTSTKNLETQKTQTQYTNPPTGIKNTDQYQKDSGKTQQTNEPSLQQGGPVHDMSDKYYPPGSKEDIVNLLQKISESYLSKDKENPEYIKSDSAHDMSDQYYPPD